jgi:fibro-slime domain-containing protein
MKRRPDTFRVLAYGLLAVASATVLTLPDRLGVPAVRASVSTEIELIGVVRDFRTAHVDFNVFPPEGFGHVAGNVDTTLGVTARPTFMPSDGWKVDAQWFDASSRQIAPHLAVLSGGEDIVRLVNTPTLSGSPELDTFSSVDGPYGSGPIGGAPTFVTGATIPPVTAPTGLPWQDSVTYTGGSTGTLSANLHCRSLTITDSFELTIDGDVVIVCDENFMLSNSAIIEIAADSSLTLYVEQGGTIDNSALANMNTADPGNFTIVNVGTDPFIVTNAALMYATMTAPNARLRIENASHYHGTFTGDALAVTGAAGYHHALGALSVVACGVPIEDVEGNGGVPSDAGITSASTFGTWFRDVMGVNLSRSHAITLTRDGAGVYTYLDDSFYPIDHRLYGNEGMAHNYFFTYALEADFVYHECWSQFLHFEGGDGVWIYIDDELVIDLGGVVSGEDQHIEVDRLGLNDGQTYRLRLFYAQRNPSSSVFRIRTTLDLETAGHPWTVSSAFD